MKREVTVGPSPRDPRGKGDKTLLVMHAVLIVNGSYTMSSHEPRTQSCR